MSLSADEQRRVVRYLLGQAMPENERQQIESRFIADDRYFEDLQRCEDRLIADYLGGALSGENRSLFETNFLASPRRRRQVEVQRGMRDFLLSARTGGSEARAERRAAVPGLRLGWVAAAALVAICGGLTFEWQRQRSEIGRLQALAAARPAASAGALSFVLAPGVQRDAGARNYVALPPNAALLQLRLLLPSSARYASYTAAVELPDGQKILEQYRLAPRRQGDGSYLDLDVPSSLLHHGDYAVTVRGAGDKGVEHALPSYVFRAGQPM